MTEELESLAPLPEPRAPGRASSVQSPRAQGRSCGETGRGSLLGLVVSWASLKSPSTYSVMKACPGSAIAGHLCPTASHCTTEPAPAWGLCPGCTLSLEHTVPLRAPRLPACPGSGCLQSGLTSMDAYLDIHPCGPALFTQPSPTQGARSAVCHAYRFIFPPGRQGSFWLKHLNDS